MRRSRRNCELEARELLNALGSSRGDWSVIPLAFAELAEQELVQGGLKDYPLKSKERQAKEASIISSYLQAIKLGQHQLGHRAPGGAASVQERS